MKTVTITITLPDDAQIAVSGSETPPEIVESPADDRAGGIAEEALRQAFLDAVRRNKDAALAVLGGRKLSEYEPDEFERLVAKLDGVS